MKLIELICKLRTITDADPCNSAFEVVDEGLDHSYVDVCIGVHDQTGETLVVLVGEE